MSTTGWGSQCEARQVLPHKQSAEHMPELSLVLMSSNQALRGRTAAPNEETPCLQASPRSVH